MLAALADAKSLTTLLLPRDQWRPYPPAADRTAWAALPPAVRQGCLKAAEDALAAPWPELPATLFLEFARNGDRQKFQEPYFLRRGQLMALAIGECLEGKGRFLDRLADGIWLLCEESSWCLPAHIGMQKAGSGLPDTAEPVLDLFAAESGAMLAWVHYLLGPELAAVSPLITERVRREIAGRILVPARERDDWWWQGFRGNAVNNWNPWINSNVLACALLLEPDAAVRAALVAKTLRSLDCFIDPYPADGGCDEGPGYWSRAGASVFDCLEILDSATAGRLAVWDRPLIAEMGRFICRAHLAEHWFINFADAPARTTPDATLVYCYGQRIHDPELMAFGAWFRRETEERNYAQMGSAGRLLRQLFTSAGLAVAPARAPLWRDSWLPVLQVLVARSQAGSTAGLTLAAKGGHNAESHNHNDVGNFIIYAAGRPVLIDAGVETYRRETFSKDRYSIWTMQSQYHNLPTLNGAQQLPGAEYRAAAVSCVCDDRQATLELDLAAAYAPAAQLTSWVRRLNLQRGGPVTVTERYACSRAPSDLYLSLLTPCEPRLGGGAIDLLPRPLPAGQRTGAARITYEPAKLQASVEVVTVTDGHLRGVWGETLYRIILRAVNPGATGEFTLQVAEA